MNRDVEMPGFDDDIVLPPAEPFPEGPPDDEAATRALKTSSAAPEESSSEHAEAPLRRKGRVAKPIPTDSDQELRNHDLADWKNNYLNYMAVASGNKEAHRAPTLAKKNAAHWVFGVGIGGTGRNVDETTNPLAMFAGNALMETLTGMELGAGRTKRPRAERGEDESEGEDRRVRQRSDEEELGRGHDQMIDLDDTLGAPGSEVGHRTLMDGSVVYHFLGN